jgi:hypothetical protein
MLQLTYQTSSLSKLTYSHYIAFCFLVSLLAYLSFKVCFLHLLCPIESCDCLKLIVSVVQIIESDSPT